MPIFRAGFDSGAVRCNSIHQENQECYHFVERARCGLHSCSAVVRLIESDKPEVVVATGLRMNPGLASDGARGGLVG